MKITFLGHACFLLDDGVCRVLTDPFLTGQGRSAQGLDPDYIAVTHGHGDHVGDTADIAAAAGSTVLCTVELGEALFEPKGLRTVVGNIGGTVKMPFGSVKFLPAVHGSGVPGGLACGFLFEMDGKKIYHAGDTALTMDMGLLAAKGVDAALLPIGDVYTMGPADALRAVELIRPKTVVPMHYDTFPAIAQDAEAFARSVENTGVSCAVLRPGQMLEL